MPKRIIDGDSLWRSQKLKKVEPPKHRAEFANLLALALANGVFEADPALVWAQVFAYNRPDVTPDDVVAMLDEFEKAKMLFRWEDEREKTWGFWVDIDRPGRLPPPSERNREKRGPEPPEGRLREFLGASYQSPTQLLGDSSAACFSGAEGGSLRTGTGTGTGTDTGKRTTTATGSETGVGTRVGVGVAVKARSSSCGSPSSESVEVSGVSDSSGQLEVPDLLSAELEDLRDWSEDRFGVSGQRLRNCIIYQLDHNTQNDWWKANPPTVGSMGRANFVRKIDADTPKGWTPERAKHQTTSSATESEAKGQELLKKFLK